VLILKAYNFSFKFLSNAAKSSDMLEDPALGLKIVLSKSNE
jgi:hypothetical protein